MRIVLIKWNATGIECGGCGAACTYQCASMHKSVCTMRNAACMYRYYKYLRRLIFSILSLRRYSNDEPGCIVNMSIIIILIEMLFVYSIFVLILLECKMYHNQCHQTHWQNIIVIMMMMIINRGPLRHQLTIVAHIHTYTPCQCTQHTCVISLSMAAHHDNHTYIYMYNHTE